MRFVFLALVLGTLSARCGGDPAVAASDTAAPDSGETAGGDTFGHTGADTTAAETASEAVDSDLGPDLAPRTNAFLPDAPATGPRLLLEVTFDVDGDPGLVEVAVVAYAIPAVFGLSYHLGYDPAALALEGPLTQAPILGPDAEAVYIIAHGPGEVALGGSRRAPTLGDTPIAAGADEVVLATLRFRAVPDRESRLVLARTYGRTADAALVPIAGGRGTLTLAPRSSEASP